MEAFEIIQRILYIVVGPALALVGYLYYEIRTLREQMMKMATIDLVNQAIDNRIEFIKEKIEDNLVPLSGRLDRLDSKLDKISDRIDRVLDEK